MGFDKYDTDDRSQLLQSENMATYRPRNCMCRQTAAESKEKLEELSLFIEVIPMCQEFKY